jgi:hypothetical protein
LGVDDALFRFRLRVFALAHELGSVGAACRGWDSPLDLLPLEAPGRPLWAGDAAPRERRRPRMPNATSPLIERRVLASPWPIPGPGPARIAAELARPKWGGLRLRPTGRVSPARENRPRGGSRRLTPFSPSLARVEPGGRRGAGRAARGPAPTPPQPAAGLAGLADPHRPSTEDPTMDRRRIMHQLSQAVRDDDLLAAEKLTNVGLWRQRSILPVEAHMPGSGLQRQALTWPTTDRAGSLRQGQQT